MQTRITLQSIYTNHWISKGKLIRLLVAEGVVQEKVGQIMEEVAEENINELINQGLLQVYDDRPYTGTKLQVPRTPILFENSVFTKWRCYLNTPTRILSSSLREFCLHQLEYSDSMNILHLHCCLRAEDFT